MLTKEMLQNCIENIDYCIKHTKQDDLKHPNKKLFQLLKNDIPQGVFFTLNEIAKHLNADICLVQRLRQNRSNKLMVQGYKIELIEYKH